MFAKKLDFLMEITATKSSTLGRICALDSSYISRLRRGERSLPKIPAFISSMSAFFARQIHEEYQRIALCDAMHRPMPWPENPNEAAGLIETWLLDTKKPSSQVEPVLLSFMGRSRPPVFHTDAPETLPKPKPYYYGPAGKKAAVLQFFSLVLQQKEPRVLYLHSDEDIGWMTSDPLFVARWTKDFTEVLRRGNRVKIIHTVTRNIHEMIEAITKWMPIYMTEMVEPFYYPKLRDGVFHRTLFLAPGAVAVVSNSVGHSIDGMLHAVITDPTAIDALIQEYQHYLALCSPLMHIITSREVSHMLDTHHSLLRQSADMICLSSAPTLYTMPEKVADALQKRRPHCRIKKIWEENFAAVSAVLKSHRYTEVFPSLESSPKKDSPFPYSGIFGAPDLTCTPGELEAHYENVHILKEQYSNYRPLIQSKRLKPLLPNLTLLAKEGMGVIMTKTSAPVISFAFDEINLTVAFWEYLSDLAEQLEEA